MGAKTDYSPDCTPNSIILVMYTRFPFSKNSSNNCGNFRCSMMDADASAKHNILLKVISCPLCFQYQTWPCIQRCRLCVASSLNGMSSHLIPSRNGRPEKSRGRFAGLHLFFQLLSLRPFLSWDLVGSHVRLATSRFVEVYDARVQGLQAMLLLGLGWTPSPPLRSSSRPELEGLLGPAIFRTPPKGNPRM